MLADRVSDMRNIESLMKNKPFFVETKYDGERMQVNRVNLLTVLDILVSYIVLNAWKRTYNLDFSMLIFSISCKKMTDYRMVIDHPLICTALFQIR